jgi:aldose sugar dehydrogenase
MPHPLGRRFGTIGLLAIAISGIVTVATAAEREPTRIVTEFCANCHANTLTGSVGPNLLDTFWNHGADDASILRSIRRGWPESGMPPFEDVLTDGEQRAMLAFIRQQGEAFARGAISLPPPPQDVTIQSERHVFRLETFVPDLDTPWGIAFLPDGRILVTERPGRLRIIEHGRLVTAPVSGTPAVFLHQDGGLLDVAVHPNYAENGWIYLAYTEAGAKPDTSMTVVVRGRIRDGRWVDQETIFHAPPDRYYSGYIHYGCRFLFDRAGHLFFTIGDRGHFDDAQDLASPCGKIHRVLDDGRVPPDNPFVHRSGALPTIWSYGHRHPQGLAFHPVTGQLWESEHGPIGGDEINLIAPGNNYGWPVVSRGRERGRSFVGSHEGMQDPVVFWTPAIAPSGIAFYTGDRFPRWKNNLFVAALGGQQLRRLEIEGEQVTHQEILFRDVGRIRHVVTGPDGLLYVLANAPGRIARLVPSTPDDSTNTNSQSSPDHHAGAAATPKASASITPH